MKQFNFLLTLLLSAFALQLQAQDTRYVDEIFTDVSVEYDVTYGTNISVLTMNNGDPDTIPLLMDVYTPVGDEADMERPVVIYMHTGSYIPQYFNGQITGGRQDSTAVEICSRLAKMGYTAISATYRQGWVPTAVGPEGQNIRTGTLLNAAYRSIQDARTAIRYLRRSVAEEDNRFGIDTERIVMWGQGTGGYISLGAAFLDDYDEVVLDKFIDTDTGFPYVIEEVNGDVYGLNATPLNIPNHVGYDSDFHLAVNMGGALGDTSWIDGVNEPPVIGYHVVTDPFAPFGDGPVIVPVTNDFVVQVAGARLVAQVANDKGTNDPLTPALSYSDDPLYTYLNGVVAALSNVPIDLGVLGQTPTTLAETHMYPFISPNFRVSSGPWDWWDKPKLDLVIGGVNAMFGTDFNADTLHNNGLITNPDMSPEKARAYIDTIMTYYTPRACQALQLEECAVVSTEELADPTLVEMSMAPNPARDQVFIRTSSAYPMEAVQVFDMNGMYIRSHYNINSNQFQLQRQGLPPGMYLVKAKFKEGTVVQRVLFQ